MLPSNKQKEGLPMNFIAKTIAAATIIVATAISSASAEPIKFSVAAEPYPPFASKNTAGVWEGFEVDLAKMVCEEMKAECEIVETAWDGIIPALLAKKIDVIFASMSITEERQQTIAFSISYYNTPAAWAAAKDSAFEYTPEGLKGKTIGVQTGTIHATFVDKYYKDGSSIKIYNTQDEANSDLAAGRIDVALADSSALEAFLASESGKGYEIKAYAPKDPIFGDGVGAGMRKEDTELKAKIDAAIAAIYKSGKFDELQKKYFTYDVGTQPRS
jgi:polar amino acid transport system substrate-binding protein